MNDLKDKKILLIAPKFFGYEVEIKKALDARGAQTEWLQDRPFDKPWQLALLRVMPSLVLKFVNRFYSEKIRHLPPHDYDIVFAVNTVTLTPDSIQTLRERYPRAKYILYMWDSMENRPHVKDILQFFDLTWCFDPETAEAFGMKFRALFYLPDYAVKSDSSLDYDLSFIGSVHADRYKIIRGVKLSLPSHVKSFFYLYLRASWLFWLQKIVRPVFWAASYSEFSFKSLSKNRVVDVFQRSKTILDIEHPKQRGLTMRTFEALGAGKKLVTTNFRIKSYDFYDPHNVAVIDRYNFSIPNDFWSLPFRAVASSINDRYSIDGWLDEVLELRLT
jgi:hypothetical protein